MHSKNNEGIYTQNNSSTNLHPMSFKRASCSPGLGAVRKWRFMSKDTGFRTYNGFHSRFTEADDESAGKMSVYKSGRQKPHSGFK